MTTDGFSVFRTHLLPILFISLLRQQATIGFHPSARMKKNACSIHFMNTFTRACLVHLVINKMTTDAFARLNNVTSKYKFSLFVIVISILPSIQCLHTKTRIRLKRQPESSLGGWLNRFVLYVLTPQIERCLLRNLRYNTRAAKPCQRRPSPCHSVACHPSTRSEVSEEVGADLKDIVKNVRKHTEQEFIRFLLRFSLKQSRSDHFRFICRNKHF